MAASRREKEALYGEYTQAAAAVRQDIREKHFLRAYLICGEEEYLCRSMFRMLTEAVSGGDSMNTVSLEGKNADESRILEEAQALPFLAEHRLVIVRDSGLLTRKADVLADRLETLPESTVLVFWESKTDRRNRLYKTIQECGRVICCVMPQERELAVWTAKGLRAMGKEIDEDALSLFLAAAPEDMTAIRQEMEKLAAYAGERTRVTAEDVAEVTSFRTQESVFALADAVAMGDEKEAVTVFATLLADREEPGAILYRLTAHFLRLEQMSRMLEEGCDPGTLARTFRLQDWMLKKKYNPQLRRFSRSRLEEVLRLLAGTEREIKSGEQSFRTALEPLIIGLCRAGRP